MVDRSLLKEYAGVVAVGFLALILGFPASADGVEATYVSTIRTGLSAPTALSASVDQIAVLQPFSKQIVMLTPDGTLTRRFDITGDTRGLARLSGSVYLYCERDQGRVMSVDIATGNQGVFLDGLAEPVDVIVSNGECHILDAGSRRIISTDSQGFVTARLDLAIAPSGIAAPTSLAFDGARDVYHVFDQVSSTAHSIERSGRYAGSYCSFGNDGGTVTRGGGLAADGDGYIYIVDRYQGRVAVFDPERRFVLDIDAGALVGEPLVVPAGIAVDANGTIYVSSMESDCVHVYFLDKTAVPEGELAAAPLYPSPAGTLPADEVKLVARLAAATSFASTVAADFRIVEAGVPDVVIDEAVGVEAEELGIDDSGRLVGTATWRPAKTLTPGTHYQWQTRARAAGRVSEWSEPVSFSTMPLAVRHNLEPNYPNPFNPQTTIGFSVPDVERAVLEIFDLRGARVWSKTFTNLSAGRQKVIWDARNSAGAEVASGVYFYRLRTAGFEQSRKMILIR